MNPHLECNSLSSAVNESDQNIKKENVNAIKPNKTLNGVINLSILYKYLLDSSDNSSILLLFAFKILSYFLNVFNYF